MSLLATVATRLGRVELHHEDGRFETRGVIRVPYVDIIIPVDHDYATTILITAERALEWHELAEREGHVYSPFPSPEGVASDRMDLQTECPGAARTARGVATTEGR